MRHSNTNVLFLTQSSVIAAIYVVLTFLSSALGLSSGVIQIRFSEALTILPVFIPAAVPGLFIGCILANFLTGCALPDIIFGSLATLIGAMITDKLHCYFLKHKWMTPLPSILSNTLIIPFVLSSTYGIQPLWFSFLTVFTGEIISCGILGMILFSILKKHMGRYFMN